MTTAGRGELRIHFTAEDLRRTRVFTRPDPLWELVLSMHVLRSPRPRPEHSPWWAAARRRAGDSRMEEHLRLLGALVPARGDFPDFLTPALASPGFDAGLEKVLATPLKRLRSDLAVVPANPVASRLADGGRGAVSQLGGALRTYYEHFLQPHWPHVEQTVQADTTIRAEQTLTGIDRLLGGLPVPIRWSYPTLSSRYPTSQSLHLAGRGITLIPSYFCTGTPVTFVDPELRPVLVYPAVRPHPTPSRDASHRLSALLGRTRAQALLALRTPSSTTQLATHIGMSLASASQHAAVLREAGLVSTWREGHTMLHSLTPVGLSLLTASADPVGQDGE
jgi:DNA-binding transcriptional ArsR family regulator